MFKKKAALIFSGFVLKETVDFDPIRALKMKHAEHRHKKPLKWDKTFNDHHKKKKRHLL